MLFDPFEQTVLSFFFSFEKLVFKYRRRRLCTAQNREKKMRFYIYLH